MSNKKKIPAPEYLKGHEFTQMLKEVLDCKDFAEVSRILSIPKSTFSTWNLHNRTSHELMVRIHLATKIPIEYLALPKEERARLPYCTQQPTTQVQTHESVEASVSQHDTVVVKSYCLENGKLLPTSDIHYAERIFNGWSLNELATIEVETNKARYLVDQSQNDAVSGKYLIDIDGRLSINQIQRLPSKLSIAFGDSTMEIAEEEIKVVGRVAVVLEKV